MLLLSSSGCGAAPEPQAYWSPDDPLILTPEPGFEPWVDAAAEAWRERDFMVIVGPGGVPVRRVPVAKNLDGEPMCGTTTISLEKTSRRIISVDAIDISDGMEACGSLRYSLLHEIAHALAPTDLELHAPAPSVFQPAYNPKIKAVVDDAAAETVRAAREAYSH